MGGGVDPDFRSLTAKLATLRKKRKHREFKGQKKTKEEGEGFGGGKKIEKKPDQASCS